MFPKINPLSTKSPAGLHGLLEKNRRKFYFPYHIRQKKAEDHVKIQWQTIHVFLFRKQGRCEEQNDC